MLSTERMTHALVAMADSLVADFDLVDFLSDLTLHAAEASGADAVGVVLANSRGALRFMASSNESGRLLELLQLQASEGPCLDCFTTRRPVINTDLSRDHPWPRFGPTALEAGFRSVHAFPMRLRDDAIGALNLFSHDETRFEPEDVTLVQALADVATIAILQGRTQARADQLAEQLQAALDSRIVIEQAKGALSRVHDVSVDAAFTLLREQARTTGRRLSDVAAEVVSGR
jgi:GAF domain-containing protein